MHDIRKTPVFGYLRTENTYQEEIDEIDGLVVVNETTAVDEQIVLGAICHCNLLWNLHLLLVFIAGYIPARKFYLRV